MAQHVHSKAHAHGHDHGHDHHHDHDDGHAHPSNGASPTAPVAQHTVPTISRAVPQPEQGKLHIRIRGMDCSEEVAVVRHAVEPLPGVTGLAADIAQGLVTVSVSPKGPSMETVLSAIAKSGLGAEAANGSAPVRKSLWDARWREILTSLAALAIIAGACIHGAQAGVRAVFADAGIPWISQALYGLAIVVTVGPLLPRAWGAIRGLRLDMNVLLVIAVIGAVALGDWFEAAAVGTLFALSLVLEAWTARRAGRAIADLMKSTPQQARVKDASGSGEREVPIADVSVGSIVIVRPGETIPMDGQIRSGSSSINQAPITGESVPVTKSVGAEVFAGCVNGEGALEIETTQPAGDTMLARIARMVSESQQRRGSAERWIDRFAQIYTPIILVIAIGVAVVPGAITGNWTWWAYQALVLLVIACPCALVISVPVCIVAGIATAARGGVIIKGGSALEVAAKLKAMAFDKTGTLTQGKPSVTELLSAEGTSEESLVALAAALETRSEHPVAHAVIEKAESMKIAFTPADQVTAVPGKGIQAADGSWAGSVAWAIDRGGVSPALRTRLEAALAAGSTVIVVGRGQQAVGGITCRDQLRPDAKPGVQALGAVGIKRLIMLSGDAEVVARHVAGEVGIAESYGSLLPDAKVAKVAALASDQEPLAMVGDGLNDAPALARANLGIAMGSATAATLETADVALLNNDLRRLPWLVTHARGVMAIMRQNVAVSLATKAIFVVLALSGHGSMWIAIAADTGVSLLVVLNALRLLRTPSPT